MGANISKEQLMFDACDPEECAVVANNNISKMLKELKSHASQDCKTAFYSIQSRHILLETPIQICVHIATNIDLTWKTAIIRAIQIINKTCPGICIKMWIDETATKQIIIISSNKDEAYTSKNLIQFNTATIILGSQWSICSKNGTALHELLHALGVQHEHKRNDGHKFGVTLNERNCIKRYGSQWEKGEKWKRQYSTSDKVHGITVYDPHSIMSYVSCVGEFTLDEKLLTRYSAYSPLRGYKRRNVLSPLDEIGLNLLYKPCNRSFYKPIKNMKTTSLYYCGRIGVTKGHNYPASDLTDSNCGPNNGPNCSACRTLKNDDIPRYNDCGDNVWQGSSGYFFCGKMIRKKSFGHDGYCGPNNGEPCDSCYRLIV